MKELPWGSKGNRRQWMEPHREEELKETKPKPSPQINRPSNWGSRDLWSGRCSQSLFMKPRQGKGLEPYAKENSHWFFQKVCRVLLMKEMLVGAQRWTDTSVHSYGSPADCTDLGLSTHSQSTVPSGLK